MNVPHVHLARATLALRRSGHHRYADRRRYGSPNAPPPEGSRLLESGKVASPVGAIPFGPYLMFCDSCLRVIHASAMLLQSIMVMS